MSESTTKYIEGYNKGYSDAKDFWYNAGKARGTLEALEQLQNIKKEIEQDGEQENE